MSRIANDWAWKLTIKPATNKLILLAMADRADEEHCSFPSIDRLVRDTSLDKKTIKAGIARLMQAGIIHDTGERKGKTQRVRVFRLNVPESGPIKPAQNRAHSEDGKGAKNGPVKPDQKRDDSPEGNEPKNGPLNEPKNGSQNRSVEPVNEPGSAGAEKSRRKHACPDDFKPNETCRKKATDLGVDIDLELDKFESFHRAKGNKYVDWQAAFRNWLTKAAEFRAQRGGNITPFPQRPAASSDDCGGKVYIPTPANGGGS